MARILYVSDGYTTHDRRFLEKLAASSHEIWYLPGSFDRGRFESRPLPHNVRKMEPLGETAFGDIQRIGRFRARLRECKPDLVHAGPVQTGAFFAACCGSSPLIVMSWGSDVLVKAQQNSWQRWVARFTLRRASLVFVDCEAVKEEVIHFTHNLAQPFVMFPWGVDLHRFRPGPSSLVIRRTKGWERSFIVLGTRGFEPIHAPFVFLEAASRAIKENPALRFVLLGGGSLKAGAEAFVKERNLEEQIFMPGQISSDELPEYFRMSNLYVSATQSDGSSISLLEAMASGLPVAVVDAYGNKEWVQPGIHGWRYPSGDFETLEKVILDASQQSAEDRAKMGLCNRRATEERANWDTNFAKLLSAYDQLLPNSTAITR